VECLDEQAVLAFVAGNLDGVDRRRTEQHLDGCPECLAVVAEMGRLATGSGRPSIIDPLGAISSPSASARYEIGEEIARGGMGRIHAAFDRRLGRRVALKRLLTADAGLARRFAREVALTARLQHPAIVPIYDSGTLDDGTPFYAMRLITGRTLDRAAAEASRPEARLALLPAVMSAIEAVAYAHEEGVVHRDLKPQNVLVGPFGEAVVLDWGLAKDLGRPDEDDPQAPSASGPALSVSASELERVDGATMRLLRSAAESGATTHAGDVLGTLGYMAPEQLAGQPADERADVHGLGALLYHVLAGGPPRRRATEPLRPLDEVAPGLPVDLVAIVHRALAADRQTRYASARELADDLRRFQAGRLVEAHRYTTGELVRRWLRRHRAAVAVATVAVAVVALLAGLAIHRIVDARATAEAERGHAETQRDAAAGLVDFVLNDLRARLETVGRIDVLRGVGAEVSSYYDRVPAPPGPAGAAEWARRAKALTILGDAATAGGDLAAAERWFRAGLDDLRKAAALVPDDVTDEGICQSLMRIGDVRRAAGDLDQAHRAYEDCAILASPRARPDGRPRWRQLLASSRHNQALVAQSRGSLAAARPLLEASRDLAAQADDARLRYVIQHDLGRLLLDLGELDAARVAYAANLATARAAHQAKPDDAESQHDLASSLIDLANLDLLANQLERAEAAFTEGRGLILALTVRDPQNMEWQRSLALAENKLGEVAFARPDYPRALEHMRASLAIDARLSAADPQNVNLLRDVGVDESTVAEVEKGLRHPAVARAGFLRARAAFEQALALSPTSLLLQNDVAVVLADLGQVYIEPDRAAARAALDRAQALRRKLFAADDTPTERRQLAEVLLLYLDLPTQGAEAANRARIAEAHRLLEPLRGQAAKDMEIERVIDEVDRAWTRLGRP